MQTQKIEPRVLSEARASQEARTVEHVWQLIDQLGESLLILGHHYQRDSVLQFAHHQGDSLELAQRAAADDKASIILFCGVHFMAETADIVTEGQRWVLLPSMQAGCSMADMANIRQVEEAWADLCECTSDTIIPLTYINSSAAIKAFCGRHGGATCTSSNAQTMIRWALEQGEKLFFFPDQHLGRNTCYDLGIPLESMIVWDPFKTYGGHDRTTVERAQVYLWKGHCSVHQNFQPHYVDQYRQQLPEATILVHPECCFETVRKSDLHGSTSFIIRTIEEAPSGSQWVVGTEHHLVARLQKNNLDKKIRILSPYVCQCATMFRNSPDDLRTVLQKAAEGEPYNRIQVSEPVASQARIALNRMLRSSQPLLSQ